MPGLYLYDIHGLVRIRSEQRLPEIAYFRVDELRDEADIEVQIVGDPSRHATADTIVYEEGLGRYGFSIAIDRRETGTDVYASPLVGRSPHVLYTNVVEPLLRWALVRRGLALMHGATLSFRGRAMFITAQTDTGKTTTILKLLKEQPEGFAFLSDDMTVFAPDGRVFGYPKPLTISQHTLQAVGGSPLTRTEKLFLQVQSRLHSRGGRRIGLWLNDIRTPAASLSAIVQWMIPPPKFMVDRLVPGTLYTDRAQLAQVVLIERGYDGRAEMSPETMVPTLVENADDAYGFPPYPALADQLSSWEGVDLHPAERSIVASSLEGVPGTRLGSTSYDWFRQLPGLIDPNGRTQSSDEESTAPGRATMLRAEQT